MTSMTPDSAAQADPQAPFVIESPQGTDWTVLYYPNTSSLPSLGTPLNRTINIVAVDQLKHALPTLKPYREWLQTCAIATSSSDCSHSRNKWANTASTASAPSEK